MKGAGLFGYIILAVAVSLGFGISVWDEVDIYRLNIKPGDVIRIKFSGTTLMNYEIQKNDSVYKSEKGILGQGSLFNFFPDAAVTADDTAKATHQFTIKSENQYILPARVETVAGNLVQIATTTSSLINGEIVDINLSAECDKRFIQPDLSIYSYDLYHLQFEAVSRSPTNLNLISEEDLVFSTNYTEFFTNYIFSTNFTTYEITNITNGMTNLITRIETNIATNYSLTTNTASIRLKLEGISEEKQREIIINYLNFIIDSLF